ncbi:MAG: hypothetical protein ABT15_12030 [Pseudonocardia sp. SCN 73-27]|nr:MAG: hypothetical protein ABS80_01995 [Pseudonocardia sp. SCN 72-51]ODV06552.1 MAG: hypothetical protein ABT15_12030 [Pseudonocardia sp. SCN 73-27]
MTSNVNPWHEETTMSERTALVTGGSAGIGLAIARALAAQGGAWTCWSTTPASAHGKAHIVDVSASTARENPPNGSVYAATTAALGSPSHSAHAELSHRGIQVTTLMPGLVVTPGPPGPTRASVTR